MGWWGNKYIMEVYANGPHEQIEGWTSRAGMEDSVTVIWGILISNPNSYSTSILIYVLYVCMH